MKVRSLDLIGLLRQHSTTVPLSIAITARPEGEAAVAVRRRHRVWLHYWLHESRDPDEQLGNRSMRLVGSCI
jgi:hypothetical protein